MWKSLDTTLTSSVMCRLRILPIFLLVRISAAFWVKHSHFDGVVNRTNYYMFSESEILVSVSAYRAACRQVNARTVDVDSYARERFQLDAYRGNESYIIGLLVPLGSKLLNASADFNYSKRQTTHLNLKNNQSVDNSSIVKLEDNEAMADSSLVATTTGFSSSSWKVAPRLGLRTMRYVCQLEDRCSSGLCGDSSAVTCRFDERYGSFHCEQNATSCDDDVTCLHGAPCVDQTDGFECQCDAPFTGTLCELKECQDSLCQNGGRCQNPYRGQYGQFSCACADGFYGERCELQHGHCSALSCRYAVSEFTLQGTQRTKTYECIEVDRQSYCACPDKHGTTMCVSTRYGCDFIDDSVWTPQVQLELRDYVRTLVNVSGSLTCLRLGNDSESRPAAPGTAAPGTVAPGTAAPGTVTAGTAAPRTTKPDQWLVVIAVAIGVLLGAVILLGVCVLGLRAAMKKRRHAADDASTVSDDSGKSMPLLDVVVASDERSQRERRLLNSLITHEDESQAYDVIRKLGAGGFGEVWEVAERHQGDDDVIQRFAMKKIDFDPSGEANKYLMREINQVIDLSDDVNIVKLHDIFRGSANKLIIVMELCDFDLASFARLKENRAEVTALDLLQQCARGLHFLHSYTTPIIHRDVKPQNMLIKLDPGRHVVVKITDFGISTRSDARDDDVDVTLHQGPANAVMSTRGGGTVSFMAPEFFAARHTEGRLHVDASVDIFALGLVFAFVVDWNDDNDYGESTCIGSSSIRTKTMTMVSAPDGSNDYGESARWEQRLR